MSFPTKASDFRMELNQAKLNKKLQDEDLTSQDVKKEVQYLLTEETRSQATAQNLTSLKLDEKASRRKLKVYAQKTISYSNSKALMMVNSALFNSTKKKKKNMNESFDSFSIMSPDMKNLTHAKLKFMINKQETFDLYNTQNKISVPLTTTRKKSQKKSLKLDMTSYDINKGESEIKSQNTTFQHG